jgi:hypothetical protein
MFWVAARPPIAVPIAGAAQVGPTKIELTKAAHIAVAIIPFFTAVSFGFFVRAAGSAMRRSSKANARNE